MSNITKKIKIILFVGLLVAIILPFSNIETIDALTEKESKEKKSKDIAPNENATKKTTEKKDKSKKEKTYY